VTAPQGPPATCMARASARVRAASYFRCMASAYTLDVPPVFFGELQMSLADTLDGSQTGERLSVGELIAATQPRRSGRARLQLDTDQARWLARWLAEESDGLGRWADWGLEGAHLCRTGARLASVLREQLEAA
jgi:hypothetical protein